MHTLALLFRSDVEGLRPGPLMTLARAIIPDMLQVSRQQQQQQ
jgi:hypothetical protein